MEPLLEAMKLGWIARKIALWFYHPKKAVHFTEIEMTDEQTFHVRNTDSKGTIMTEFDIKNGSKSQYKIRTGILSYIDSEVILNIKMFTYNI